MNLATRIKAMTASSALLVLVACGFEPVNAPPTSGGLLQDRVQVTAPSDRSSYLLVQRLEERLGRAAGPIYTLSYDISVKQQGLAVDEEGDVLRFNLVGRADYTLRDQRTGQVALSGSVSQFTGYSATGTTVASLAAERDANRRLMNILADEIVIRLQAADLTP